jgi:hypothetical protein
MKILTTIFFATMLSLNSFAGTPVNPTKKKSKATSVSTQPAQTTNTPVTSTSTSTSFFHTNPVASSSAFTHELFTNVSMGSLSIQKACKSCDSTTAIDLHASYLHLIQDKIQAGVEGGVTFTSGSGSNTLFDLAGIAAYNFESNLSNSPFIKAGLGFFTVPTTVISLSGTSSSTETKIGLFIGGGKRFSLLPNVTYVPEARLIKKGDLDIAFEVTLLNFSIHWN